MQSSCQQTGQATSRLEQEVMISKCESGELDDRMWKVSSVDIENIRMAGCHNFYDVKV